ncbi:hypothetical protein I6N95_05190 [Vagococcus sp. BWB3-3]|uniref:Uncharacterized protein n=1 Tax=Vagococcus allomyrinae TaxID=2794353 RepID=A0A940P962_9ENTE|nr:hypothetical protein [Vagococcus allomyrinae]MBP1040405.1 hypothetical protein [Vagococcus allomyrinae]
MGESFNPVEYAKQCIKEKVDASFPSELVKATIPMEGLIEITGVSRSTLETKYVSQPEFYKLQVNEGKKRLWLYPEIRDAWREIKINEKNDEVTI